MLLVKHISVSVVVQFYPWFKFYFPLFWGMVMYDNEFKTWSCDNFIACAMLFMALHAVACTRDCTMTSLMLNFNSVKYNSCCKKS